MNADTWTEQIRLLNEAATSGSNTWTFSPRESQAIGAVLKRLAELEAENGRLKEAYMFRLNQNNDFLQQLTEARMLLTQAASQLWEGSRLAEKINAFLN